MARDARVAIVRRENPSSSPPRRLHFLGVYPPALSDAPELAQWLHATDQTEPGLYPADEVEAQRSLAYPCGLAHRGPDQRAESGDQGLEPRLPHRCGQGGLHRIGSFHVRTRSALYETASPENIWLVENA